MNDASKQILVMLLEKKREILDELESTKQKVAALCSLIEEESQGKATERNLSK